jgi:hypothetical protein
MIHNQWYAIFEPRISALISAETAVRAVGIVCVGLGFGV